MQKQFTQKSFTFFTINFVVGIGFITTISTIMNISYWGYLVMILSAFICFGIMLVFSRLSNQYNDHYGGSYAYARHLDDDVVDGKLTKSKKRGLRNLVFFIGWNQFIQTPLLSAIAPLFLADVVEIILPKPEEFPQHNLVMWIVRGISILLFISIIAISTIGLKTNKKIIFIASLFKWIILILAIFVMLVAVSKEATLPDSATYKKVTPQLIIADVLLFMYAFAGTEDVAAMAKDVKFKSFRKILLTSLAFIFGFYLIFFSLYLFLPNSLKVTNGDSSNEISKIYTYGLGAFGVSIFIIGLLCNDLGFRIFQTVATARKLVPLSQDGYLFNSLHHKNKKGEFKNAIVFSTVIIMISMITLWLVPTIFLDKEYSDEFFKATIITSSIALLIEDLITFFIAFRLAAKKRISKIPVWEKTIYIIDICIMSFILLITFFPWILSGQWEFKNTVSIIIYVVFIGVGFALKLLNKYKHKFKIYNKWIAKHNKQFDNLIFIKNK
ncbi:APC family permease [Mycoplasma sp. 2045]|uniref:amino acid permease n=1 Tax=Mycoplasma sp. 2045 TaxID=2967301 RepID=UPI00211BF6CA|nr:APC family permease [Mycoplasma sp. 2045]UUM20320.1 APC family permease [Mycoplasma sp. 2045]